MLSGPKSKLLKKEMKYLFWGVARRQRANQIVVIDRIIFKVKGKIEIFILMCSAHNSSQGFAKSVFSTP